MPENTNEQIEKGTGGAKAPGSTLEKPTGKTAGVNGVAVKEDVEAKGSLASALAEEDLSKVREKVEREPVYVKDEWLKAMLEGNLRFPQIASVGIGPFIVEAVLRDGGSDLEEFSKSELTEEQLQKVGAAMNAAHAAHHIPIGTEDKIEEILTRIKSEGGTIREEQGRSIPPERLNQLWTHARNSALEDINMMKTKISLSKSGDLSLKKDKETTGLIHDMAATIVEVHRSEEGRRIAKEWRASFDRKPQDAQQEKKSNPLFQMDQLIRDRIQEKNPKAADWYYFSN